MAERSDAALAPAATGLGPVRPLAKRTALNDAATTIRATLPGVVGTVALVALWELIGRLVPSNRHLLPPPTSIAGRIWQDRSLYPLNIETTAKEATLGFAVGAGAAILSAIIVVQIAAVESYVTRLAVVVRALPLLAIAPILIVVFPGLEAKVVMAAIVVYFPTFVAAIIGLRAADRASLDLVRALGGGRMAALFKVRLWASLPWMFSGLLIAAPTAVVGAILGEFFGGSSGLGVALIQAMATLDTARVWGLALAASALSGVAYAVLRLGQRLAVPWKPTIDTSTVVRSGRRGSGSVNARRVATRAFSAAATVIGILIAWTILIAAFGLNRFFAKTPTDVWAYLSSTSDGTNHWSNLWGSVSSTLGDAALGFIVGTTASIALALIFVLAPRIQQALMPIAIVVRSVPVIALVPLLIVLFGSGIGVTLAVTTIISFFPTLVNMTQGLRSAPQQALDVFRTYNASRLTTMRKLQLLSALPALFASLRIALLESILGALVVEWLATGTGLGQSMIVSLSTSNYALLWTDAAAITAISAVLYGCITAVEAPVLARFAPNQIA